MEMEFPQTNTQVMPPLNPEALEKASSKINELAVLPHVVFKVLEASTSETAPAAAVERSIIVDPGFSTKILQQANSAGYGIPKRVTSIREAILYLGFRAVRNLAMTVGTFDLFVGKTDKESLRRRGWWRSSIDTAICAKWLAHALKKASPDDAYTCGLLHLIGLTLMDRLYPSGFEDAQGLSNQQCISIGAAQRQLYGFHYGDYIEVVATKWQFPAELAGALNVLEAPREPDKLRAITTFASICADLAATGVQLEAGDLAKVFPTWTYENLEISEQMLPTIVHECMSALNTAHMHLAG